MSPKFLLIFSIFITILFNNNNSEQFDSNPCKGDLKLNSANPSAPSPRSFDWIRMINKQQKRLKCECIVENGGKFSLHRCFLPKLENFDKGRMLKLAMRFRISNSTMKNFDANMLFHNILFMDGAFLDDYYGPIDLNCSSLETCFSNKWRQFYGEQISIQRTKKGLNIEIKEVQCPNCPPSLVGKWPMNKTIPNNLAEVEAKYPCVQNASWKPTECIQKRMRIAIVIPHRNRTSHLRTLLNNLHQFMQKQQADYRIFVADQAYPKNGKIDKFNKAKLLNAAFTEIQKREIWGKNNVTDCYIFQDVDLVPDYDTNIYRCDKHGPIRLYSAGDEWNYAESGDRVVGGICAQTGQQFVNANGFSNVFWGWGTEDEDIRERYRELGPVEFVQSPLGYYSSLELNDKPYDPTNPRISDDCDKKLKAWRQKCWKIDGLKNLNYELRGIEYNKLYTNISIDVLMEESRIKHPHPCGNEINQKGTFRKTFIKYKHSNLDFKDMQNIKCT